MKEQKQVEFKHVYTKSQLIELGGEIANEQKEIEDLEAEKKKTVKSYSDKIEEHKSNLSIMCYDRRQGFEIEEEICDLKLDPVTKERIWIGIESGEERKREPFQEGDEQKNLFEDMPPIPNGFPEGLQEGEALPNGETREPVDGDDLINEKYIAENENPVNFPESETDETEQQ
jgi:hypothetical protein